MSIPRAVSFGHCRVLGAEKLPAPVGGADALCAQVEQMIASRAPSAGYAAEISVISASRLAATLIVNGQTLPVQNFAVMDRNLSAGSIKHFAESLATAVAEAAKL